MEKSKIKKIWRGVFNFTGLISSFQKHHYWPYQYNNFHECGNKLTSQSVKTAFIFQNSAFVFIDINYNQLKLNPLKCFM